MTKQDIVALIILVSYFSIAGILGILLSKTLKIDNEIKRKILHSFGFLSFPIFLYAFDTWYISCISSIVLGVGSYILISIIEKRNTNFIQNMFSERHPKEIKMTILLIFLVFSLAIIASWGCLYTTTLALLAIFGWGFGDMSAALIGKRLGKHHYKLSIINKKTIEGTIACFISIFITSMIILFCYNYSPFVSIVIPLLLGLSGSIIELLSFDGLDTLFMPIGLFLFSLIIYII